MYFKKLENNNDLNFEEDFEFLTLVMELFSSVSYCYD
jgi:hypothetical protein